MKFNKIIKLLVTFTSFTLSAQVFAAQPGRIAAQRAALAAGAPSLVKRAPYTVKPSTYVYPRPQAWQTTADRSAGKPTRPASLRSEPTRLAPSRPAPVAVKAPSRQAPIRQPQRRFEPEQGYVPGQNYRYGMKKQTYVKVAPGVSQSLDKEVVPSQEQEKLNPIPRQLGTPAPLKVVAIRSEQSRALVPYQPMVQTYSSSVYPCPQAWQTTADRPDAQTYRVRPEFSRSQGSRACAQAICGSHVSRLTGKELVPYTPVAVDHYTGKGLVPYNGQNNALVPYDASQFFGNKLVPFSTQSDYQNYNNYQGYGAGSKERQFPRPLLLTAAAGSAGVVGLYLKNEFDKASASEQALILKRIGIISQAFVDALKASGDKKRVVMQFLFELANLLTQEGKRAKALLIDSSVVKKLQALLPANLLTYAEKSAGGKDIALMQSQAQSQALQLLEQEIPGLAAEPEVATDDAQITIVTDPSGELSQALQEAGFTPMLSGSGRFGTYNLLIKPKQMKSSYVYPRPQAWQTTADRPVIPRGTVDKIADKPADTSVQAQELLSPTMSAIQKYGALIRQALRSSYKIPLEWIGDSKELQTMSKNHNELYDEWKSGEINYEDFQVHRKMFDSFVDNMMAILFKRLKK